jgi:antitoxin component of MazEF toxin-antitoxin module
MNATIHVHLFDPQGHTASVQLPPRMAQALRLQNGQILDCSLQQDASVRLQPRPDPAAPAAKKGDPCSRRSTSS